MNLSTGNIAFGNVKSCKKKDFEDGNAVLSWEMLLRQYDPMSAPSLVKTENFQGE
jgi:hypothetical protein